jgi:hypothetical protein
MKHRSPFVSALLMVSLLLTGCRSTLLKMYGMRNPEAVDEKMILEAGKEYGVPPQDSYALDTAYMRYLRSFDNVRYKEEIKNHYQPLQALYFNKAGQLISFHVNCYAGGSPNLAWDRDSILNQFPPKQQTPPDSLLPLATQLKFLQALSSTAAFNSADYDYIVVIYWNRFMYRQSQRLIALMQANAQLAKDKKVKIIYANNDNIFALAVH